MLEITRELVEHYLRATGWASVASDPNGRALWSNGIRWINEFDGDSIDDVLDALQLEDSRPDLRFRLGLCAAAERDFAEEKAIGLASNQAAEQSAARGISGIEHLRDAGIEYLAWESARKR